MSDVTQLLAAIHLGEPQAAEALLPLVYDELRKLAAAKMAQEKPGHTLEATALVHEAYLRLVKPSASSPSASGGREAPGTSDSCTLTPDSSSLSPDPCPLSPAPFDSRGHFFAAAATAMRRILIENARRKLRLKHGGQLDRVELADLPQPNGDDQLLALDEALTTLALEDPQAAQVVELHHFAGLSHELVAQSLGITVYQARQKWSYARAWLLNALAAE